MKAVLKHLIWFISLTCAALITMKLPRYCGLDPFGNNEFEAYLAWGIHISAGAFAGAASSAIMASSWRGRAIGAIAGCMMFVLAISSVLRNIPN